MKSEEIGRQFGSWAVILMLMAIYPSCAPPVEPLADNWEKAVPYQKTPMGLISIKAKDCGICHQEIYKEWQLSTHAHAWTDLQFQAELKKESSPYLCINCHIPLENQQEFLIKGLRGGDIYQPVKAANPNFDPELQLEGISCSTCHVRDGHIIGTNGFSTAPHPVKMDTAFLNEQLCMGCHNASAVVTPELVCTFQTGDEWMEGPYFGEKNCISCHMDTITRPLMPGLQDRTSHRHWFPGSGIPKRRGLESKALQGMAFYPDTLASSYDQGDSIHYQLKLVNEFAGHRLPTGDPERFYLINLRWENAESEEVVKNDTFRIGEEWVWYPEAKKVADNNMDPQESRLFITMISPSEKGAYHLYTRVTKHRMDPKTAEFNNLGEEYPLFITVFDEMQTIQIQ